MQIAVHVFRGFRKKDNVVRSGAFLKLHLTLSGAETELGAVSWWAPCGDGVCRVVACLLSLQVDARQDALEK